MDSLIQRDPGSLQEIHVGDHPLADDGQGAIQRNPVGQQSLLQTHVSLESFYVGMQMHSRSVPPQGFQEEFRGSFVEHHREHAIRGNHQVNLSLAGDQGLRAFQAHQPAPHDQNGPAGGSEVRPDGFRVRDFTQIMDSREPVSLDLQLAGGGPGRDEQPVIRKPNAAGGADALVLGVDRLRPISPQKADFPGGVKGSRGDEHFLFTFLAGNVKREEHAGITKSGLIGNHRDPPGRIVPADLCGGRNSGGAVADDYILN